ncbi:MAG TPA: hypothetical protein VMT93_01875, partial [Gemmatimonadaceae bacterium]|nr:hypothetical protein [Gemmatimonadaceae bacterium]
MRSIPVLLALAAAGAQAQSAVTDARVVVHTERAAVNRFDPLTTFGGGLDGHSRGVLADIYTPENL